MTIALWIGVLVAGGLGSVARFLVDRAVARRVASSFPAGTLAVNASGAVLLGVVSGLAVPHTMGLLAGTALIGSYTTFSSWMLETHRLSEERQTWLAISNLVVSVLLGLAAVMLGQWIASQL